MLENTENLSPDITNTLLHIKVSLLVSDESDTEDVHMADLSSSFQAQTPLHDQEQARAGKLQSNKLLS